MISKLIIDLSLKCKILSRIHRRKSIWPNDHECLDSTAKVQSIWKKKLVISLQLQTCSVKYTVVRVESKNTDLENIFSKDIFGKGLGFKICKKIL